MENERISTSQNAESDKYLQTIYRKMRVVKMHIVKKKTQNAQN